MYESAICDPPLCRWWVVIIRPLLVLINMVAVDAFLLSKRGSLRFPSARSLHSITAREGRYRQNSFPLEADKLFDPDLVRALDLVPTLQQVALHCATHRGRQALLSLVHQENPIKIDGGNKRVNQLPERGQLKKILRRTEEEVVDPDDTMSVSFQSTESSQSLEVRRLPQVICAVASSAEEAFCQQQTVNQALQLLGSGNYPPLYPAESDGPTDRSSNSMVTTDDDEWLHFSKPRHNYDFKFDGYDDKSRQQQDNENWSLEHILQAEQVVRKIVKVYDWAVGLESSTESDLLTGAAMEIPIEPLRAVLEQVTNTVRVVRVRSFMDPLARSTYSFCLNDEIFPVLQILRKREKSLVEQKQQQPAGTAKSEKIVREIADLRKEIAAKDADIQFGLSSSIFAVRHLIDQSQNTLAHLDVTFAKAAYGLRMMEAVAPTAKRKAANVRPRVDPDSVLRGTIRVDNFLHPLLMASDFKNPLNKTLSGDGIAPVPIDLMLGGYREQNDATTKALIISGPNGGGKTLALKSFGIVCAFSKLGIPIPGQYTTVDFFDHILTAVGDQQNIARGESTFTAQLNRYSSFLKQIHSHPDRWHLVLLDELGSGTEENAGGAIGQAVLEAMLAAKNCRVVATTHSPKLKALSFHSREIGCAAVLLHANDVEGDGRGKRTYKRPLYKLQYGVIGESQSMNAAQCCNPPFPETVLERAAQLLDGSNIDHIETIDDANAEVVAPLNGPRGDNGSYLRALTASLERQLQLTQVAEDAAWRREKNSAMIQHAMMKLASAYENHLEKLERRVENCYKELQQKTSQGESDPMQILGDTLAEVRLVRKQVKSEEELLTDRGLKRMRDEYVPTLGESIVVVDENSEWNGTAGVVVPHELLSIPERKLVSGNSVVVELDIWSGSLSSSSAYQLGVPILREIQIFQRYQLAIWDYESVWEGMEDSTSKDDKSVGKAGSKRRLASLLSKLTLAETPRQTSKLVGTSPPSSSFTSSRERKSSKRKNQQKL